ncbi:hypothetical protein D3C87_864000 [compost metagenome]
MGAVWLPVGSISMAVNSFLPCSSGVLTCSVHLPSASTIARPSSRLPVLSLTVTMMVSPVVPVPLSSGRLSSVLPPEATLPVTSPTSSATPVMASLLASGGVTSISKSKGSEGLLSLPAGSRAMTVMEWSPSFRSVEGVKVQAPFSSTSVVPITVSPSLMTMVSPGVPSPWNSGWRSSVTPPGVMGPWYSPMLSLAPPTWGCSGGVMSTTNSNGSEGLLSLPAGSRSTMVMECSPSLRSVGGVKVHTPSPFTSTRPISLPWSCTMMVSPGVPWPLNSGRWSSVAPPGGTRPLMGPTSSMTAPGPSLLPPSHSGLGGGVVSTPNSNGSEGSPSRPAGSLSVMVMEWLPSLRSFGGVKCHAPLPSTRVLPISLPLSYMVMVLPGVPVPKKSGRVSSVWPPGWIWPWMGPTSS